MLIRTLFAGFILAGISSHLSTAQAQDFTNVITFGDSLSDTGNAFALSGGTTPPSPPYADGRFTGPVGSKVWVEYLAGPMQNLFGPGLSVPLNGNINAAVGGAWSISTPAPFSVVPDVPDQIDVFKALGGTIGGNDLVTLWAGANNLFGGQAPDVAAAGQVVNLNRLLGPEFAAKNILIANLPPLPGIPIPTNPSIVFNQVLGAGTRAAAAANPGANIVQMDVFNAFIVIVSNPQAFGFNDISTPCFNSSTGAVCDDPTKHLFWDDVHPSGPAHELLGLYAGLLLSTGQNAVAVAPLAESAFNLRLDASQAAFNHTLDAMAFPGQWHPGLYAEVIGAKLDVDGSGSTPGYQEELGGVRGGVNGHLGGGIAGVSLAYLRGNHGQPGLSADVETFQGDVYGAMQFNRFFVSTEAGISYTNFDNISRFTGFRTVNAQSDANGWSYSAAVGAGTVVDMSGFRLIPNARLGYLSSDLDAFSETAPILALDFAERTISSGFWSLGLRAATDLGSPQHPITAYAEAGYESLFATDTDGITAQLSGNTALPVSVAVDDPASRGFYLKAGAGGHLNEDTTLSVDYGLSLREGDGESHTGRVQLKFLLGRDEALK